MQVHSFVANSAGEAVAQIREQLGPEAVVLHVRPVSGAGLSRLWQKGRIEVLAYRPEAAPAASAEAPLAEFRKELADLRIKLKDRGSLRQGAGVPETVLYPESRPRVGPVRGDGWRIGELLESAGLLPIGSERVLEEVMKLHGPRPPESLREEIELAKQVLRSIWASSKRPLAAKSKMHVLVGAPGVGKTTCLCKWLAKSVLIENRTVSAWRLDGRVANTAESLTVYCEILDVPVERAWSEDPTRLNAEILFVDLPGINWRNAADLAELAAQLGKLPDPQIHLVLNAAYDLPVLMDQIRAFAPLPVTDLVVTHLDEESRWGKLWNLVLGTNFTVRYLSSGQNVPGEFQEPTAEMILARQFSRL